MNAISRKLTWQQKQDICFQMIANKNYNMTVCDKETDYAGVDCIVDCILDIKKVDVKGETTLQDFPDTILISLGWSYDQKTWHLPKYLERNDVNVWVCDVVGQKDIFCLTPEMLDKYRTGEYDFIKDKSRDHFGRYHKMAVINKEDCNYLYPLRKVVR